MASLLRDDAPLETPKGMGDLLPPEASVRRALSLRVLHTFELSGYELVTPPIFEHAEVVQRGNDAYENRDLLRFVEPESGEVAVLRPDITPQIARIVATRLTDHEPPFRLCYEGRVFRRLRGRARSHRQITQAGLECVGVPGVEGDTEVISLAIGACAAAGLAEFRIELGDIRLVRSLLEPLPADLRRRISDILAQKDAASLRAVAKTTGMPRKLGSQLEALLQHYGDSEVLDSADRCFRGSSARAALRNLRAITRRFDELGLGSRLCFDLSETRGLSYYTGMHFSILAHGPGEALGGGGRYDGLLGRFGFEAPATGFALDLGHLQSTLPASGRAIMARSDVRVAIGGSDRQRVHALAESLRRADLVAAILPEVDSAHGLAFARTWGYDAVLTVARTAISLLRVADGTLHTLQRPDPDLVRRLATSPGN
jgi:ATP phosphoribosyltransferase regulatory subunit